MKEKKKKIVPQQRASRGKETIAVLTYSTASQLVSLLVREKREERERENCSLCACDDSTSSQQLLLRETTDTFAKSSDILSLSHSWAEIENYILLVLSSPSSNKSFSERIYSKALSLSFFLILPAT